ncbi:glutamyl aminopeptidase-like [Nematostella vectensis]|uniref:glutamyl aminopeptidase-like n=1 Tax=Nematostella vectensis TaxID=45351 RepID=UPI00207717E8|nr:glutamyl aminopeptidase-like [Nematostella vectensis]
MKATFTTTIVHEPDYTALTNMPEAINKTRSDGLIETRFMKSVPMSTYLLAFIVCDFKHTETITGEHNNVTLRVWTTPDQINQTYFALDVAEKIITYFEKYYKVMYPLPKQDLIAIPDFSSGAMENWGLITFRETALLYQPGVSSESNKQRVAVVVSHELAHQWFGNIVSPKWWNDLWLNEGFASYVEYLGVNHTHPDWQMLDQFLLLDLQLVLPLDSLATSHPISVEVDHPKKIKQIFDRISYSKGSSIIRMLAGFLGDDLFTDGLQHYLKKFAFKNAETKDLWEALGETSKTDVKTIMDTWTLQMGFPVVKVGRVGDSNKARLTQKHFLLDPGANVTIASPYGYKWYIPFTYVTQTSPQSPRLVWMNMSSAEIQIPPLDNGWVKGNYQQIGYYRVHYDDNNWRALVAQLNQDHEVFTSQDRSSLLNDAFSLARAGYLKYDIAMSMLTYLDKERSYVPWKTALNALSYLKTVLANRPSYGNLQKFIRGRLAGLANELGWEMKASDSHIDRYLRGAILGSACSVGLPEAVGNASRIFKEWQTGERASISVDLRSIVYRYGIAATGPDEWDWMFARYQASMDASEKISLLEALGHSKQTWILNKLLASSLNSSIVRTQDTISVILSVAGNPVGKYLAWNFVRANWENLLKEFGTSTFRMTSLVNGVTSGMNTDFDLKQMRVFYKSTDAGTSENARKQSEERTLTNIAWLQANEETVETWLRNNV